uniref:Alkyl transferase n=1 Tax=Phlebotomus papatasi TaxID=29031 RepID=A0A1B0D0P4_PHLPP
MDGNRRYAKDVGIPLAMGHVEGFQMMQRIIRWLYLLQVPEVTVYAFSIENFKRPQSEIAILFSLVRNAIHHIKRHEVDYKKYNTRVKVIGRLNMLPKDIKESIVDIETKTKDNDGFRINIAVAYTSRDDIAGGIRSVCSEVQNNLLKSENISVKDIERNMLTNNCSLPEILIRTSGETRLNIKFFAVFPAEILAKSNSLGCDKNIYLLSTKQ